MTYKILGCSLFWSLFGKESGVPVPGCFKGRDQWHTVSWVPCLQRLHTYCYVRSPGPPSTLGLLGSPRPRPPSQHPSPQGGASRVCGVPGAPAPHPQEPACPNALEAVFTSCCLLTGCTVLARDTFHSQEEPATWRQSMCPAWLLRSNNTGQSRRPFPLPSPFIS